MSDNARRVNVCLLIMLMLPVPILSAADPGHFNDFNDGVQGWEGEAPQFIESGGPNGDGFMQLISTGTNGPGSRMAAYSNAESLTGDFLDAGIAGVEVDLMNMESSQSALDMRLVLFGPNSVADRWTSNDPVNIANDGNWQTVFFPIAEDELTRTRGSAEFDQMIENVLRIMIRHDSGSPSAAGDRVVATLGVDNFRFVSVITPLIGDFDENGALELADINLLLGAIKDGGNDATFDITGDGPVDTNDLIQLVETEMNTYVGDVNLDLEFGSADLVQLFRSGEYEDGVPMNSTWATGDWDGDGDFTTGDLSFAFRRGGYEQGPRGAVAAVPEPTAAFCFLLGLFGFARLRHQ